MMKNKTKTDYPRALNPQVEKMRGSTGSHVVLYFVHRLGDCLERRIISRPMSEFVEKWLKDAELAKEKLREIEAKSLSYGKGTRIVLNGRDTEVCLECGVDIFDGGTWGYCTACGNKVFDKEV